MTWKTWAAFGDWGKESEEMVYHLKYLLEGQAKGWGTGASCRSMIWQGGTTASPPCLQNLPGPSLYPSAARDHQRSVLTECKWGGCFLKQVRGQPGGHPLPLCPWNLGLTVGGPSTLRNKEDSYSWGPIGLKQRDVLPSLLAWLRRGQLSMNTDIILGPCLKAKTMLQLSLDEREDLDWGKLAGVGGGNPECVRLVLLLLRTWSGSCAEQGGL